jgi:hypothetical protein
LTIKNNKRKKLKAFLLFLWPFSSFTKASKNFVKVFPSGFLVMLLDRVEQLGSLGMGSWESTEKQHCKMVQLKSTVEQLGCCRMDS